MQLILLAGQSNMAGRAEPTAADRVPHPRIFMLDREGHWRPAVDPMHFDKPGLAGVGPGRSFALELAARDTTAVIGLVPTAVGATSIDAWEPGASDTAGKRPGASAGATGTHPFDDAVRRIRIARASGTFVAILWAQGETDGDGGGPNVTEYELRLRQLIGRLRAETGAPDAPFLIGGISHFAGGPWPSGRATVDSVQQQVALSMPKVAYVPSSGLTDRGDHGHFSRASAIEFGRRFADTFAELVGQSGGP
jgi:hypothetical protein